MDAARPRSSAADGRAAGDGPGGGARLAGRMRRRALVVTGVAAAVTDAVLWAVGPGTFAGLPGAYWLMAGLAVLVDARPYVVADRRASSVILPSICFTFAIALAWGFVPALAVQVAAVTVAGRADAAAGAAYRPPGGAARGRARGRRRRRRRSPRCGSGRAPTGTTRCSPSPRRAPGSLARYGLAALVAWFTSARRTPADAAAADRGAGHRRAAAARPGGAGHRAGGARRSCRWCCWRCTPCTGWSASAGESERAARVDALTGLPNRRALQASVAERCPRGERQLALLLLDLDRFRNVNDALGHRVGDRLLVEVAHRLADVVPAHDLVVRLGGDEFAVLATRVDGAPAARRIARHLAEALNRPFALDGMPVDVTASIGIALAVRARRATAPTLLREAEAAMYDAKQRGDQVAVYGPDAAHHSPDRLALLADLRRALREDARRRRDHALLPAADRDRDRRGGRGRGAAALAAPGARHGRPGGADPGGRADPGDAAAHRSGCCTTWSPSSPPGAARAGRCAPRSTSASATCTPGDIADRVERAARAGTPSRPTCSSWRSPRAR